MENILPSVEALAEIFTKKQVEIETLFKEAAVIRTSIAEKTAEFQALDAIKVDITEKTAEIQALYTKLSDVIENIDVSTQTCIVNLRAIMETI